MALGGFANRSADALAMSLWPSRGLELHGFEVKQDRGDWLKELKKPAKAEPIYKFCDRWWLVIGDAEIVKPGELPETWGLMIPKGSGLKVDKPAPILQPEQLTRTFVAALLRRAAEVAPNKVAIEAAEKAAYDRGYKSGESQRKWEMEQGQKARQALRDFEELTGLRIEYDFELKRNGPAIKLLADLLQAKTFLIEQLELASRHVRGVEEKLPALLAMLNEWKPQEAGKVEVAG